MKHNSTDQDKLEMRRLAEVICMEARERRHCLTIQWSIDAIISKIEQWLELQVAVAVQNLPKLDQLKDKIARLEADLKTSQEKRVAEARRAHEINEKLEDCRATIRRQRLQNDELKRELKNYQRDDERIEEIAANHPAIL